MNIIDELLGLVADLEGTGTPYALCGGLAVGLHGCPRFTHDIDNLAPREALERVREAAHRRRFVLESGSVTFGAGTDSERERPSHSRANTYGSSRARV
ncbi:MAG: hypothetical protein HZA53_11090 [Planctomycetes bacterium]|nr:hypothetical protein [Planctomycetota bacterium]